jgi:hypothetical protein
MSPLKELERIASAKPQAKKERVKPRRVRRKEERDRLKAAKSNQK